MARKNPYYDKNKAHHTPTGFRNIEPTVIKKSDLFRWLWQHLINRYPHDPKGGYQRFNTEWLQPCDFSYQGDAAWWLGHSSVLFQLGTTTVLTDPIFSSAASFAPFLVRRHMPAPVTVDELPHIDIIAISHNHYDHLDKPTIRQLLKRFPQVKIVVPLGLKRYLLKWGANEVIELDWWQHIDIETVRIICVPARHWSRRTLFDTNETLWCGWIIQQQEKNAYFMGDLGYAPSLKEIAERYAPFDLAAIPIGAYGPRWFMSNQHIDPQQAVQLFNEMHCRQALAIHWGTFTLSDEPIDEPAFLLRQHLAEWSELSSKFHLIKVGGFVPF